MSEISTQPLMPIRRLHNYVYCPRLFYLQWVENLFEENADTVAGSSLHNQVDKPSRLTSDQIEIPDGKRLRSLKLQDEKLGLLGVIDLLEGDEDSIQLIEYKKGSALRESNGNRIAKEYDAMQVAAQALLLRNAGHYVSSASIYYAQDKRHVPVELTEELFADCLQTLEAAKNVAEKRKCPPPLKDDPRCNYCSAYPICLPRESQWWSQTHPQLEAKNPQLNFGFLYPEPEPDEERFPDLQIPPPRPAHNEGEVLVVQTPGAMVGKRGGEFTVSIRKDVLRKLPAEQVRSIYLYGPIQMTAQATQAALELNIDVAFFAASGRFLGALHGLPPSGIDAQAGQYRLFDESSFQLRIGQECIRAKIHNQRVLLMRNGEAPKKELERLASLRDAATTTNTLDQLLGIEGLAANIYFEHFSTMIKASLRLPFDFHGRNRRPPRDPINALLSLGYSILAKELSGILYTVGLDPFKGFMHVPRYGRPALALDIMEEFRPLIADSVAITLINRNEVDEGDFHKTSNGTFLSDRARRRFWEAWFRRLDTGVKHPQFKYTMSYRRMLEVQARQLWRIARGDVLNYHGFTTR